MGAGQVSSLKKGLHATAQRKNAPIGAMKTMCR